MIERWHSAALARVDRCGPIVSVLVADSDGSAPREAGLLAEGLELARNIIGSGEDWLTELSTGQLRELLELRHSAMEEEG